MSEYNVVESDYKDSDCIVNSLKEIGYECEVHEIPKNLYGYAGDKREEVANIIVRRKNICNSANDIGFLKQSNGTYKMIISEYDLSARHSVDFKEKLKQYYSKNVVLKQVKRMGYSVASQTVDEKGKVRIRVRAR